MTRLWQLDATRGIAVAMMLLSNFLFDLVLFDQCSWCYQGVWFWFARLTAALFVFCAGASAGLSKKTWSGRLRQGGFLIGIGLLITIATYAVVGEQLVLFGILHLIGVSRILVHPFTKRKNIALVVGGLILALFAIGLRSPSDWLLWVAPIARSSVDYTPIIPWFGVFLVGFWFSSLLPKPSKERAHPLVWIGQHSLLIYLVHQPLFVGAIFVVRTLLSA